MPWTFESDVLSLQVMGSGSDVEQRALRTQQAWMSVSRLTTDSRGLTALVRRMLARARTYQALLHLPQLP